MSTWFKNVAIGTAIGVLIGMLYASGILDVVSLFSRHHNAQQHLFEWHSLEEYVARFRTFPLWCGLSGAVLGGIVGFLPKGALSDSDDAPSEADASNSNKNEEELKGWRIRYVDSGIWAYEERNEESWMSITFRESGDTPELPKVIIVPSADAWRSLPAWAAQRRNEILGRIQSELKRPQYAIQEAQSGSRR